MAAAAGRMSRAPVSERDSGLLGKGPRVSAGRCHTSPPHRDSAATPSRCVGVVDTVLIDQETVYAPRTGDDQSVGLKGTFRRLWLDLLRQRSLSARYGGLRQQRLCCRGPGHFREGRDRCDWPCAGRPSPLSSIIRTPQHWTSSVLVSEHDLDLAADGGGGVSPGTVRSYATIQPE